MSREQLRRKRIEKGLTQGELAELSNISRNFYCDIENGKRGCKMQTWLKIFGALEIPENEMIPYITEGIKKGA